MAESNDIRTETLYIEGETARGTERVEGILCLPAEEREKYPTVVLAHGFGGNYHFLTGNIAKELARRGYAAYAFNFRNPDTRVMLGTSVLTEADTLNLVLDHIGGLPFVDGDNMFLLGESQGGFVSAYVASTRNKDDISALILYYPAFVLQDDARRRNPGYESTDYVYPEVETVGANQVSGMYSRDALSFDIYDLLPQYKRDVLIIHGTADAVVPLTYSERALDTYDNARLIIIPDAGHGFYGGEPFDVAVEETAEFMDEVLGIRQ